MVNDKKIDSPDDIPDDSMFINPAEKELWIRGNNLMSKVTVFKTMKWSDKEEKKSERKAIVEDFDKFIKDYTEFQKTHAKYGFKAKFNVIQMRAVKNMI